MIQPRGLLSRILFVCLACFSVTGFAQTIDPEAVLIRNVLLIDPNEEAEDRVVNILIREDKLEIITNVDSPEFGNPSFDGYWVALSWVMTGEMRAYNKKSGVFGGVPVAKSVYQNGKGAWELSTRWSRLDLDDGLIHGGKLDILSAGLTWWLNPIFGVNVNYRYIWNELDGSEGTSSGINSRLLLILQ